jgi:hypothetical protein
MPTLIRVTYLLALQLKELKMKNDIKTTKNVRILDIPYRHLIYNSGDEMYITNQGLAVWHNLLPENFWTDKDWFQTNSERQRGSGNVYKIRTKPVGNTQLDIVLKWNRMGVDVPGETFDEKNNLENARFLSPFEEFHLLQELKESLQNTPGIFELQVPLAIYVPVTSEDSIKLGRREYLMSFIQKQHNKDVGIDFDRNYAVIYQWIEGINIVQAYKLGVVRQHVIDELTEKTEIEMRDHGFLIADHKAEHLIVKPVGSNVFRDDNGNVWYGYVDYELLERTPEREKIMRKKRRNLYLKRMPHRFNKHINTESSLQNMRIFDVPYLYSEVPSSRGRLWVVGNDPILFDYFLPEKWRHVNRTRLSKYHDIFYKMSRDGIHLVLKTSKIGLQPDVDPFSERGRKILEHGYNSPFEEVTIALELERKGLSIIYPRAIYMTGSIATISEEDMDNSRYISHANYLVPDKQESILKKHHDYIVLWGYWNILDEMVDPFDSKYHTAISALSAFRYQHISKSTYFTIMEQIQDKMWSIGFEDLNFQGTHILLTFDENRKIVTGKDGYPITRICNFEYLKKSEQFNP